MDQSPINFANGQWLNPPARHSLENNHLTFDVEKGTDFWRNTHYGFDRHSGHALLFDVPRTFVAEVDFRAEFQGKYEQAGLLLRESDTHWIKFGVENADGMPNLAAVVTRGMSDWSMAPAPPGNVDWTFRLTATENAVILHCKVAGRWQILRVADFEFQNAQLGPMACAPETEGLSATFTSLRIGPVSGDPLYLE